MHHYPFHPGDYMLDTAHLTLEEDATYRRLLDFYYTSEKPIPLETESVSRRLRVGSELVARVLSEFFEKRETGWHHTRCDAEISRYQAQANRARANGKLGGRPQNQGDKPSGLKVGSDNKPRANPEETGSKANQNQEPRTRTNNQEPESNTETSASPSLQEKKNEIGSWFHRKPTTLWSAKELKAWSTIAKSFDFESDDWQAVKWFYTASGCKFLRRDLLTLLNNWTGEIDRAKNFDPSAK